MQPRYQVFVSSTFRDLRDERQAILEAILELGHFPAGMETFPAADATPWELIRSIIAESDYYILVVGGRYGSTGPEGISYTEMEFNLAVELNKPILAFIHGAPDQIPAGKSELESSSRQRLDAFRARVSKRHCKTWANKGDLKSAVLLALVHAIRTKPTYGWVRNEGLDNQELLKRLASLQARYDALAAEASELRALLSRQIDTQRFEDLDELHTMSFTAMGGRATPYSAAISWSDLFFEMAHQMLVAAREHKLKEALKVAIVCSIADTELGRKLILPNSKRSDRARAIEVADETLDTVLTQLMAKGLVEPKLVLWPGGELQMSASDRCWELTAEGRAKFLAKRAILST